jgi:hypothetical protein
LDEDSVYLLHVFLGKREIQKFWGLFARKNRNFPQEYLLDEEVANFVLSLPDIFL